MNSKFEVASETFYRDKLESTYQKVKTKIKDMILKENPDEITISVDGRECPKCPFSVFRNMIVKYFKSCNTTFFICAFYGAKHGLN